MQDHTSPLSKRSATLSTGYRADVVTVNLASFTIEMFGGPPTSNEVAEISRRMTEARTRSCTFDVPSPAERAMLPARVEGLGDNTLELWAKRAILVAQQQATHGLSVRQLWLDRRKAQPTILPIPLAQCDLMRVRSVSLNHDEIFANANYFLFESRELDTPFDAFGDPVGLVLTDGLVLNPPQVRRACLCIIHGKVAIRDYAFDDISIVLPDGNEIDAHAFGAFDEPRHAQKPVGLARYFGAPDAITPAGDGVVEIAMVGRYAAAIAHGGKMPIPRTGCVLRFPSPPSQRVLDALREGQPITYRVRSGEVSEAVQAGPRIIQGGVIPSDEDFFTREGMFVFEAAGDLGQPSPASWKADWHSTRAARLGAGIRADGSAFLLAVEGQSAFLKGAGRGATLFELAEQLRLEGAVDGIHLDGGGSTQLFRPYGGSLLRPGDFYKAFNDTMADYDRPLPLGLRVKLQNTGSSI